MIQSRWKMTIQSLWKMMIQSRWKMMIQSLWKMMNQSRWKMMIQSRWKKKEQNHDVISFNLEGIKRRNKRNENVHEMFMWNLCGHIRSVDRIIDPPQIRSIASGDVRNAMLQGTYQMVLSLISRANAPCYRMKSARNVLKRRRERVRI